MKRFFQWIAGLFSLACRAKASGASPPSSPGDYGATAIARSAREGWDGYDYGAPSSAQDDFRNMNGG